MADPDPYQLTTCPYNRAHQVEHYRLHIHLQKCRKQYPNCKKKLCPFDATHVVNDMELDYHVSICPKRLMLDRQVYVPEDEPRAVVPMPPPVVKSTESWHETNSSFKPDLAKKAPHIIVKARGLTPSERKKMRAEAIRTYKPAQPTNADTT